MKFWWVNQNQTAKHEIDGGYMWSPKVNQNGRSNPFYDTMHQVDAGDIVFSFVNQHIKYLGIVQAPAVPGSKPTDFGLTGDYWNNEGWYVPVEWHEVPAPFRPRDHFDRIKPTLPQKYSPLNTATGKGLQSVYLAAVPDEMADVLLDLTGAWSTSIVDLAKTGAYQQDQSLDRIDDQVQAAINEDQDLSETEKKSLIAARKGQGLFRRRLCEIEPCCRVTRVSDARLLRASHIKPWRNCANSNERLDGNNGLLLAPHIDLLFDRGYITFEDNGELKLSGHLPVAQFELLGVPTKTTLNVGAFNAQQRSYLAYHRTEIFLKS